MARSRAGRFLGFTENCQTTNIQRFGGFHDVWCIRHGEYLVDCLLCGRVFHSKRPHTKFCSMACQQRAYRIRNGIEVR